MANEQEPQNKENQQQDASKDHKKFENVVEQINALLMGDQSVFKNKVPNGAIGNVMSKLTQKRNEKAVEEFSEAFDKLLDEYVLFQRDIANKRKEVEKAIAEKEKEFTKKANDVLARLENIGQYMGEYKKALQAATSQQQTSVPANVEETPNS